MSILGLVLAAIVGVSLGFFGGGGSILTVPLLVYVFGLAPKPAIASSLLIVGIASLSGALHHWRAGNLRPREGFLFGGAAMTGAYIGGRTSAFLDGGVLLLLFASMMLLTSIAMWRGRKAPAVGDAEPHATAKLLFQGLAVGSFTGLVGAGGGFLIVPALALWAGLPMAAAIGTSLFVIVLSSAAGFAGYSSHADVDYALAGQVALCAVLGSFAGSRLARRIDPTSVRRAFAGFVLVMASLILLREGALVANTATAALPTTLPQLFFAVVMLGVGIFAGRASRTLPTAQAPEATFRQGEGI